MRTTSYLSCNIVLILKSFINLIYIGIVPWTTSKQWKKVLDNMNLDRVVINQGEGGMGLGLFHLWHT